MNPNGDFSSLVLDIYSKKFGKKVLYEHSLLRVEKGDFVIVFGESGSGKTTLLRLLMGLDRKFDGKWVLNEEEVTASKRWGRIKDIASFVFQDIELIDYLSAKDNILLPYHFSKTKVELEHFSRIVSLLQLDGILEERVDKLSGGERQRIAIGRALITRPQIVFADEPTSSLDDENVANVMSYLKKINEVFGVAIVMVSHRKSLANWCKRSLVIKNKGIYENN